MRSREVKEFGHTASKQLTKYMNPSSDSKRSCSFRYIVPRRPDSRACFSLFTGRWCTPAHRRYCCVDAFLDLGSVAVAPVSGSWILRIRIRIWIWMKLTHSESFEEISRIWGLQRASRRRGLFWSTSDNNSIYFLLHLVPADCVPGSLQGELKLLSSLRPRNNSMR